MTTELDALLGKLREEHWTQRSWGPAADISLLAYWRQISGCVDVVLMHSEDDATAYRVPLTPDMDVWHPGVVWWQYHSTAVWVLRAVLSLPEPGTPNAPHAVQAPNRMCRLPEGLEAPIITRPLGVAR